MTFSLFRLPLHEEGQDEVTTAIMGTGGYQVPMARALTVELPESVTQLFGTPEQAAAKAKESLVMELLRQEQIGQSLAAELLGVTRARVLELMDHYAIPQGPDSAEALDREVAAAHAVSGMASVSASGAAKLEASGPAQPAL